MRRRRTEPVRIERDRAAHGHGACGHTGLAGRFLVGDGDRRGIPLQIVLGVSLRAFHRAGIVQAEGVRALREVRREVRQQIAGKVVAGGVAIKGAGKPMPRFPFAEGALTSDARCPNILAMSLKILVSSVTPLLEG